MKPPPRLDWSDPAAVDAWARDVYTQARDGLAAGEDATRPPGLRDLGRHAARGIIEEAARKLDGLYRFADLDARRPPPAPGTIGGGGS